MPSRFNALGAIFSDFSNLPSPNGIALELLRLVGTERGSLAEITRLVRCDPTLAGRIIRAANGASMAAAQPIASLEAAVMRLGSTATTQIALGFSLVNEYRSGFCEHFDYRNFWINSLLRALASRAITERLGDAGAQEIFACGLLLEIGRLAFATARPSVYSELLAQYGQRGRRLREAERSRFGLDHGDLGCAMLEHWRLPARQLAIVKAYFDLPLSSDGPGREVRRAAWKLALADAIAGSVSAPADKRNAWRRLASAAAERLNVENELLEEVSEYLVYEAKDWMLLFEFSAPEFRSGAFSESSDAPSTSEPVRPLRILLVDDCESDRLLIYRALVRAGHNVQQAADGEQALAHLVASAPQVLVTDLDMPRLNGIELCRTVRRASLGRELYMIALVEREWHDDLLEVIRAGVNDYVSKNDPQERLLARLAAAAWWTNGLEHQEQQRKQLFGLASELALRSRTTSSRPRAG